MTDPRDTPDRRPPDVPSIEQAARDLAREVAAAHRPGRAIPLDDEDDRDDDGVGPVSGVVP